MRIDILSSYKERFENILAEFLKDNYKGEFREMLEYALSGGGKRLRPAIMLALAEDIGLSADDIKNGMIGLEFIHNYSLIQDDLPSFDNDDMRRGRPSLHKKYTECKALLASDIMLNDAIYLFSTLKNHEHFMAWVKDGAGPAGLLLGQYYDMSEDQKDLDRLLEVFYLKTGKLFEIAYLLPFKVKGDMSEYDRIFKSAYYFGNAFQIHNDLKSEKKENKGILRIMSRDDAVKLFREILESSKGIMSILRKEATKRFFDEIYELMKI